MTRVQQTIRVKAPIDVAFDYVADFSTTEEWDPGIAEASRLDVGPEPRGQPVPVVADFNGRKLPLEYTITAFDRPRRVVLVGDGSTFHGVDEITFESAGGGTMVTYVADLRLKGIVAPRRTLHEGPLRRARARRRSRGCSASSTAAAS